MAVSQDKARENFNEMARKMSQIKGADRDRGMTMGWDIVVSYSEADINKLLSDRFEAEQSDMIKIVEFDLDIDNDDDETIRRTFKLEMGAPQIAFHGAAAKGPSCELKMLIKSGTWTDAGHSEAQPISKVKTTENGVSTSKVVENPFVLSISGLSLGTVMGKVSDDDKTRVTPANANIKSGNETIEFEAGTDNQKGWVTLNFELQDNYQVRLDDLVVEVLPNPKLDEADFRSMSGKTGRLANGFKSFFLDPSRVNLISYAIAAVSNEKNEQQGVYRNLAPRKFRMATFKSSDHPDSILSLFIHVADGKDSGVSADLQASWSGQWVNGNVKSAPIPIGYTATIMMNPDLVFSALIQPGMEHNIGDWYTSEKTNTDDSNSGITWDSQMHRTWSTGFKGFPYTVHRPFGIEKTWQIKTDGFSLDFSTAKIHMELKQVDFNGNPVVHCKWDLKSDQDWDDVSVDEYLGEYLIGGYHKKWRAVITVNKDVPCNMALTDSSVGFALDLKSTAFFDLKWEDRGDTSVLEDLDNFLSDPPPASVQQDIKDWFAGQLPSISVYTSGLGFFRTQNLLMPGKQVIDIDEGASVKVPLALVMVGNIFNNY